jgi:hypothetical protein
LGRPMTLLLEALAAVLGAFSLGQIAIVA